MWTFLLWHSVYIYIHVLAVFKGQCGVPWFCYSEGREETWWNAAFTHWQRGWQYSHIWTWWRSGRPTVVIGRIRPGWSQWYRHYCLGHHTHNRLTAFGPGLPGWAGTRRNTHPLTHPPGSSTNRVAWRDDHTTWQVCHTERPRSRHHVGRVEEWEGMIPMKRGKGGDRGWR